MELHTFFDERLAHASYLVASEEHGVAVVIDPGRESESYRARAATRGLQIVAVAETHIHADFRSGSWELARRTGARLFLSGAGGADWSYRELTGYDHQLLRDGDRFTVGALHFHVLHTPGHSPEHLSFLVADSARASEPIGIFTGDFVLVGSVGRPDLLTGAGEGGHTTERSIAQLFVSLQRFKTLPDYLQLWPAHGAGSACGKQIGALASSTVGYEKRFNPALAFSEPDAFARFMREGQPQTPAYFGPLKRRNRIPTAELPAPDDLPVLDVDDLLRLVDGGAVAVDLRGSAAGAARRLPEAMLIPPGPAFLTWAGTFLPAERPIVLIGEAGESAGAARDLRAIGRDDLAGFVPSAALALAHSPRLHTQGVMEMEPVAAAALIRSGTMTVIDVREAGELQAGTIAGARHCPLGALAENLGSLPADQHILVVCQSGYRSAIAASLLRSRGFAEVMSLRGGMRAWTAAGLALDQPHRRAA